MSDTKPTIQELQEQLATREQQMFDLIDRRIAERFAAGAQSRDMELMEVRRIFESQLAQLDRENAAYKQALESKQPGREREKFIEELRNQIADLERQLADATARAERVTELETNITEAVQANTYLLSVNEQLERLAKAASIYVGHRISAGGIDEWLKELGADELYEAVRAQEEASND